MKDLYTYVIGVEPNDWTFNDTKACKRYGITCKGYYVLGDNEGMVLVGTLSDIENFVENYFGAGIAKDYLCPYDMFDFEDGRWITGSWFESKKSNKESLKERYEYKVDAITDIIRSNNDGLNYSCNILDEYAFDIERGKIDWLSKNAYNEISIAYANCVQYLRDEYDGKKKDELIDDLTKFFDKVITLTESKKSARKSMKESIQANRSNAISLQIAIEEYFNDNNLDCEIVNYDFGNDFYVEWDFECEGEDFKYIDDDVLCGYIEEDVKEFRNENFEVFSYRNNIQIRLSDEFEESKKPTRKSMKESKKSFEEFEDICYDNFSFAIDHTHEYKGAYFVVVYGDEKQTEKFAKILRNNGFETTWYRLNDPHHENYLCYEIMAV